MYITIISISLETKPEWSSYTIVMKTDGVNFPLPDSDPCNDSGLDCSSPFVIGTEYEFHKKIPIDNATANVYVNLSINLTLIITCYLLKIEIDFFSGRISNQFRRRRLKKHY